MIIADDIKHYARNLCTNIKFYSKKLLVDRSPVISYWWRGKRNVGDLMGPYLLGEVFKSDVYHINDLPPSITQKNKVFVSVGSILQQIDFPEPVIWGTGLIDPDRVPDLRNPKFLSVRGPLTRKAITKSGYTCPSKYGDPALLLGRLIQKNNYDNKEDSTKTNIGLVLHYKDEDLISSDDLKDINQISVKQSVPRFCNKVRSQDVIFSTSLHGIVTAHAFNKPAVWLKKCDNKTGTSFKYRDYILSTGQNIKYVELNGIESIEKAIKHMDSKYISPPDEEFVDEVYNVVQPKIMPGNT